MQLALLAAKQRCGVLRWDPARVLQEVQAALRPTPFTACTGESLVAANPSLLAVRAFPNGQGTVQEGTGRQMSGKCDLAVMSGVRVCCRSVRAKASTPGVM